MFGFHANADITKDIGETNQLYDNLILCSGSSKGGSGGQDEVLKNLVQTIRSDFPGEFDIAGVS